MSDRESLDTLGEVFEGQIILVNMYHGLMERASECLRMIERGRLRVYFKNLAEELSALPRRARSEVDIVQAARNSAWCPKTPLLRKGAPSEIAGCRLVVFRTLDQIRRIVSCERSNQLTKVAEACKRQRGYEKFTHKEGKALADAIDTLDEDAPLFLSIKRDHDGQRLNVWYTREADCQNLNACLAGFDKCDPNSATEVRNWLGLGRVPNQMPLFAFVATDGISDLDIRRPFALDAMDHPWFKFRRRGTYLDNWGRATNITNFHKGHLAGMDGGPEAIGPSLSVKKHFRCIYIGKVNGFAPDPHDGYAEALANPGRVKKIVDDLANILWP